MGTIRRLTTIAASAALLGLAASAFVRTHFSAVASIMAPELPQAMHADAHTPAEGDGQSVEDPSPERTPVETDPSATVPRTTGKGRHPARRGRPAPLPPSTRDAFSESLDRGISKLGEHRYEIKRSALERALGNLGSLSRSVHVAADLRDGKPFGFRLFAIRSDGPIAKLGLRNDDVLVSINGLDIATADRALDAYNKLRTAGHLVLGLVRDGRELRQDYSIR
jgi:hypothetical protein